MNTQGFRGTMMGSARLLWLVLRHVAAPFVSFLVSYAAAVVMAILVGFLALAFGRGGQVFFDILCVGVGFCGVWSGARCLPRGSRRIGSIVLVLLGLIYFYYFVAAWGDQVSEEGKTFNLNGLSWVRLVSLAIGGLLATVVIWWSTPNKSPEPPIMVPAN